MFLHCGPKVRKYCTIEFLASPNASHGFVQPRGKFPGMFVCCALYSHRMNKPGHHQFFSSVSAVYRDAILGMFGYCGLAFHSVNKRALVWAVFSVGGLLDMYGCCAQCLHKHCKFASHLCEVSVHVLLAAKPLPDFSICMSLSCDPFGHRKYTRASPYFSILKSDALPNLGL